MTPFANGGALSSRSLVMGPDGNLWFTQWVNVIGEIDWVGSGLAQDKHWTVVDYGEPATISGYLAVGGYRRRRYGDTYRCDKAFSRH